MAFGAGRTEGVISSQSDLGFFLSSVFCPLSSVVCRLSSDINRHKKLKLLSKPKTIKPEIKVYEMYCSLYFIG
jgi:hypothetical protein